MVEPRPELADLGVELVELGAVVLVAALADRADPMTAPPASPPVTRAAEAQILGLLRILSLTDTVEVPLFSPPDWVSGSVESMVRAVAQGLIRLPLESPWYLRVHRRSSLTERSGFRRPPIGRGLREP